MTPSSLLTSESGSPSRSELREPSSEIGTGHEQLERHVLGPIRNFGWSMKFRTCSCGHQMLGTTPEVLPTICDRDEPETFVPKRRR